MEAKKERQKEEKKKEKKKKDKKEGRRAVRNGTARWLSVPTLKDEPKAYDKTVVKPQRGHGRKAVNS